MLVILLSLITVVLTASDTSRANERHRMVRLQIERRGITDQTVLEAMRTVPRHRFVPEVQADLAYEDFPLPIGYGQTISQPYIVAYMTEVIQPQPGQRILEIGTGSGYQAAVLAEIVGEVYTIELVVELASEAKARLEDLNYDNVTVMNADGYFGWSDSAPFDAVVVTAAAAFIPPPLIEQLKDGGRMIIPVGSPFLTQSLMLVEKRRGRVTTRSMMPVRFVPFRRSVE